MKTGIALIAELKGQIAQSNAIIEDRYARIGNGETDMDDCFVSHRSDNLAIEACNLKLRILENGGVSTFDCLRDKDTNEVVSKKVVQGAYGPCHLIEDAFVGKFGRFVGVAKKDDTYAKKGLVKSTFEAAAWVAIKSNGTGMWGAYNATAEVFQSSVNYFTGERN